MLIAHGFASVASIFPIYWLNIQKSFDLIPDASISQILTFCCALIIRDQSVTFLFNLPIMHSYFSSYSFGR